MINADCSNRRFFIFPLRQPKKAAKPSCIFTTILLQFLHLNFLSREDICI